jgi:hypothetical protein
MQLTNILLPIAMLASFTTASPLDNRGTGITPAGAVKPPVGAASKATPKDVPVHIAGTSKRDVLGKRSGSTITVWDGEYCLGDWWQYVLDDLNPDQCYGVQPFSSVAVDNSGSLQYDVYAGPNCNGSLFFFLAHSLVLTFISHLGYYIPADDYCYNVDGNTVFLV